MKKIFTFLISGLLVASASMAQVANGLIACYPFSGNANDQSGNNHNGTVIGATLTTDRFGNPNEAYQFNGISDYINIGSFNGFTQSDEFSISVWIQPNQVKTQTILMLQPDDFNDRLNAMAYYSHNGQAATIWDFGDCAGGGRLFQTGMIFSNSWQHFVYTVKPNAGMKIYKNGILTYTLPTNSTVGDRMRDLWIGGGIDNKNKV